MELIVGRESGRKNNASKFVIRPPTLRLQGRFGGVPLHPSAFAGPPDKVLSLHAWRRVKENGRCWNRFRDLNLEIMRLESVIVDAGR